MPAGRRLTRALQHDRQDRDELAEVLFEHKVAVYIDTLADLASSYGYEVDEDQLELAAPVVRALRDEARDHAKMIVDTFNSEVEAFVERNADREADELISLYEVWANDRIDARSEQQAITEAYSAHVDATLAFFAENELEPDFDFGGHGDDDPACPTCQALFESNPHPMATVTAIGTPHIGCRQSWHPNIEPDALPDVLRVGGVTGGVLGGEPLVNREGSQDAAVEFVRGGVS